MTEQPITVFIEQLRNGDEQAAAGVWEHYYSRLIRRARTRLHSRVRRVVEEEDVVLDAMESCFRGIQNGRFPDLRDRWDLWGILLTITERKASNANRDQRRQKRGGGQVRGDSAMVKQGDESRQGIAENFEAPGLTPEFEAQIEEECERRLALLDDKQRKIAVMKLEGYKNREIAEELGCAIATVERKLKLIRELWTKADET